MEIRKCFRDIQDIITKYDFTEEQKQALMHYADRFTDNEELLSLAESYYMRIFESEEVVLNVNALKEEDGLEQGMLFAMIYLVRCEVFGEVLREMGIPQKYGQTIIGTYKNLFQRNYNCYNAYGFSGMYRKGMIQYIKPKTFRIGRLCYEMSTFSGPYTVYQKKDTLETVPLLKEGLRYLPEGKQAPKDYEGECFTTGISESEENIKGYTVLDDGKLNFKEISLCKEEYEAVLKAGDPILAVHIPGNEKMTPESIADSFQEARAFFEHYYKEAGFKAFVCSSWLLDTGLKRFMKGESNILKFQQNFKIVLSFVNTFALYWNIFGIEKFIPFSELVPGNRFQREVLEFLENGGNLYSGNGYILY